MTDDVRFRTLEEAVGYLTAKGFSCSPYKLSRDHSRRGRINRDREGYFTQAALDSYARAHCKLTTGETLDAKSARLTREKQEAETEHAKAQAARRQLQLARERGEVVERTQVERELAARAVQLRGDFESFAHEVPLRICDRWNLGAEAIPELREILLEAGREWLHRYREAREFLTFVPVDREASP